MKFIISIILSLIVFSVKSQNLDVSVFHKKNIQNILIEVKKGKYKIYGDGKKIYTLRGKRGLYAEVKGSRIFVRSVKKELGVYSRIEIKGRRRNNIFRIKPLSPQLKSRTYDDNIVLEVTDYIKDEDTLGVSTGKKLQIVNNVNIEKYIAGVVESEAGAYRDYEYYKTQALICRTYALRVLNRHKKNNCNLCDGVHCQAYYSRNKYNKEIKTAVFSTEGMVIVDSTHRLIDAVFHSNSGGQTANSEDVWLTARTYLKNKVDSFSVGQKQTTWTKVIPLYKWNNYFRKQGFNYKDIKKALRFVQTDRKANYIIGKDTIPLTLLRRDWNLRSTYFSIYPKGNRLVIKGKGYGHGVGLSQEGAMNMARKGYSYLDIINYYYEGVKITPLASLKRYNAFVRTRKKRSFFAWLFGK